MGSKEDEKNLNTGTPKKISIPFYGFFTFGR